MSVADLKYVNPSTLRACLCRGPAAKLAIVDLRDSDYIGGHIKGSWHYPAGNFNYTLGDLQQRLVDNDIADVVFHCALSQVRGPQSALKYIRSVDDVDERMKAKLKEVKVWVLRGGFSLWAQEYGEDDEATEGFVRDLWLQELDQD